jgi:hypothetical protein
LADKFPPCSKSYLKPVPAVACDREIKQLLV